MRVGVVQMECNDTGDKEANMRTLRSLVEEACRDNSNGDVQLVLGPEFAICGYSYDYETMWNTAERQGQEHSPTERFLCEIAQKHGIYFGVSYLEAREFDNGREAHFLNTFALAGPKGTIEGRVCKSTPASVEAFFFRGPPPPPTTTEEDGDNDNNSNSHSHVIECRDTGYRIGVLICYENFIYNAVKELQEAQVDLLLSPFSGPLADDQKPYIRQELKRMYDGICSQNAKYLGCPVLYCNKVGKWKMPSPTKFMPMTFDTEFPGSCAICNANGELVGGKRLSNDEMGVLVGDIVLASSSLSSDEEDDNNTERQRRRRRQGQETIPRYLGGYSDPSLFLKVCILYEWLGARSYNSDELRKRLAREALEREV